MRNECILGESNRNIIIMGTTRTGVITRSNLSNFHAGRLPPNSQNLLTKMNMWDFMHLCDAWLRRDNTNQLPVVTNI